MWFRPSLESCLSEREGVRTVRNKLLAPASWCAIARRIHKIGRLFIGAISVEGLAGSGTDLIKKHAGWTP